MPSGPDVTQLLIAWSEGRAGALDQLAPLVESELRRLAAACMRRERPDHLLQATALVNEAYLRLIPWKPVQWNNRAHFFGVAAQLMRHVLVDLARKRTRTKRGGAALQVSLSNVTEPIVMRSVDLVALDDALDTLTSLDARQGRVVELRYFGGLTNAETAQVLNVSVGTVRRDWSLAQAWLYRQLNRRSEP